MEGSRSRAISLTVLAAVLWSTGGLFIKLLPQGAFAILFYRSLYASLLLVAVFGKGLFNFNKMAIVSSLFYAPLLITFVWATKLTTAANAIFLQYTAPAFVLLLEPWLLKTRLTKVNILTVVACLGGMALFFSEQFSTPEHWLGIWLAVASGFILTGLLITQKMNLPKYQPGAILLGNIWVCLAALPATLGEPLPGMTENFYLMLLGFGQLGLGYVFFLYGQKHLPAIESALIAMLEPILNPVWVFLGHGEFPGWWAITGGAVIIAALALRMLWMEWKANRIV
ncbi:MAG: DMT family transporter [Saprospiraceae bacterium]|nr:DMT family transporter [Saprospiraceae bacterium]